MKDFQSDTTKMSLWELFGIIVCSEFGIGGRPSHRRKRSTSEPCFDPEMRRILEINRLERVHKESIDAAPESPGHRSDKKWHLCQIVRKKFGQIIRKMTVVHEFRFPYYPS
jgi:hypothetical protein